MTLLKLVDDCRRLQIVMQNNYLDLDPVLHLSYEEASGIYVDALESAALIDFYVDPPVPGTFWYTCYGIRTFVERIES